MDPMKMAKQMIDFNKMTFDNAFSAMILLQEQNERIVSSFLEQATWLPAEGKKVLNEWIETLKKGRDEYKSAIDESFKKVEAFFAEKSG